MTALWILLGILALLGAVLSLDLTLSVEIREQVRITAGFLWFRFQLLPFQKKEPKAEKGNKKPPREKKRKRDAPLEEKAAELEKEPVGEKTFGETVELVLLLVRSALLGLEDILTHLRFTRMRIAISVGMDSADQTALAYGGISAGVYNLLAVLDKGCVLRLKSVDVAADFVSGETVYDISFRVRLRLARIVWDVLRICGKFLAGMIKKLRAVSKGRGKTKQKRGHLV